MTTTEQQQFTYDHPRPRKKRFQYWLRITGMLLSRKPDEEVMAIVADGATMFCAARVVNKFGDQLFGVAPTSYRSVFARDGAYWGPVPDAPPAAPTWDIKIDEKEQER